MCLTVSTHRRARVYVMSPGVQGLLDELAATPEWRRLGGVPGLLEPWGDVRDKGAALTGDFKACGLMSGFRLWMLKLKTLIRTAVPATVVLVVCLCCSRMCNVCRACPLAAACRI